MFYNNPDEKPYRRKRKPEIPAFYPSTKTRKIYNTKINHFKDFDEYIFFMDKNDIWYGENEYDFVDKKTGEKVNIHARKFVYNADGVLVPRENCEAGSGEMFQSLITSAKRAKDNFYGYAFCNSWNYFATFTINPKAHSIADKDSKYYWKLFRQKLQYIYADVKIIAVPERHKKGNFHFHALLGNCNIDHLLTVAINPNTDKPICKGGRQVYNLPLWDKGFTTVVKIDGENGKDKSVSYLAKYLSKAEDLLVAGYNQKRYYCTKNLDFKTVEFKFVGSSLQNEIEKENKYTYCKKNKNCTIYRVPK